MPMQESLNLNDNHQETIVLKSKHVHVKPSNRYLFNEVWWYFKQCPLVPLSQRSNS